MKKAKIVAAKKEKSLSEIIKESLEEKIVEDSGYRRAKKRSIRLLERGFDLRTNGNLIFTREELHVRE